MLLGFYHVMQCSDSFSLESQWKNARLRENAIDHKQLFTRPPAPIFVPPHLNPLPNGEQADQEHMKVVHRHPELDSGLRTTRCLLKLTPSEYDLLVVLMEESHHVVGRAELLRRVWVQGKPLRVVDTYICRLRAKLQRVGHPGIGVAPRIGVATKRGYRLIPPVPTASPLAGSSVAI